MKKALLILLAAASFAQASEVPQIARMEVTSVPERANVIVNGVLKGATPLTLADLKPGVKHHMRLELQDYEPHDRIFTPAVGLNDQAYVELQPVKGVLLVTSEPEGAGIFLNGYSMGETPRLITSLDVKSTHSLILKKVGYLESKLEVRFSGRKPLHHNVKMVLNSGVANIRSEPDGAEVILNGIPRGTTPVTVSEIPDGRLSLVLKKSGYKTISREISINAGDVQDLYMKLDALPGTLNLSSVPEGARFYVDGEPRGTGPLRLAGLEPSRNYRLRAEMDGFEPVERNVYIGNGQSINEEFRMVGNLGQLEIKTLPAGASVEVDGRKVGTTKGDPDSGEWSDSLIVPGLKAGEHTVRVKCYGHAESVKHQVVEVSRTVPLKIRLTAVFTPDVRIETATDVIDGIFKSQNEKFITIETKRGIERVIPRENVRSFKYLDKRP